jgi:hypothetical protein
MAYNYEKLMNQNPYVYETYTNSLDQEIKLCEHPTRGDESFVIAVCDELQLADDTTFFETGDMTQDHREYEPSFRDGILYIGDYPARD